jgi:hypothetical protein
LRHTLRIQYIYIHIHISIHISIHTYIHTYMHTYILYRCYITTYIYAERLTDRKGWRILLTRSIQ